MLLVLQVMEPFRVMFRELNPKRNVFRHSVSAAKKIQTLKVLNLFFGGGGCYGKLFAYFSFFFRL